MNEVVNALLAQFNGIPNQDLDAFLHEFAKQQLAVGNGRVINVDGSPYLTRVYLRTRTPDFGAFLHFFHKGDQFRDLHSHPCDYAWSVILTAGYDEERCEAELLADGTERLTEIRRVSHKPGDLNFLTNRTYHRVELPNGGCWTLFIRGQRTQGWSFINRETGVKTIMDADETTND